MLRAALLGAAGSRTLQRFAHRHGMNLGARRFVAGETLDDFSAVARGLNERGLRVAAGLLGEDVRDARDARAAAQLFEGILERIAAERLQATVALKLTHLGLEADPQAAYENVRGVVERARELGNFVRLDMESSRYVDPTLHVYRRLRAAGYANVGAVLQSYLYRSQADLRGMLALAPNLRLVKGAYLEPPAVAYRKKSDVDENFARLVELCLREGGFTAVATHDERLIERAIDFIRANRISADRYEFQMLYGVRPALQADLVRRGFPVRVAVPFGTQWYPYLMRRLAERPANVLFFASNMWRA